MQITADRDVCAAAGQCASVAGALFDQDDDGIVAITQLLAAMPNLRLVEAEQDEPIRPFPSELPTYHAGDVLISW